MTMDLNRFTPVPPISASESDAQEDKELEVQVEKWRPRIQILEDKTDYENQVKHERKISITRFY